MATKYFDRYKSFRDNGNIKPLPLITIPENPTDKKVLYKLGETRLDKLSQDYYNVPYYGWLIMLANPEFGGLEFNIPDRSIIRVPFPFNRALEQYENAVKKHFTLYGR